MSKQSESEIDNELKRVNWWRRNANQRSEPPCGPCGGSAGVDRDFDENGKYIQWLKDHPPVPIAMVIIAVATIGETFGYTDVI